MSFDQNNINIPTKETNISEENNYLSSNSKQNDFGKKKQRLPDPNAPCYIHRLSVEVVTHIFSRLDPVTLTNVARVCRYWRHIVNDDGCWRDAFISYFGRLPYRRLSLESWKTEYILRTHLIRKWTKNRGSIISFIPKIGSLESMYVDFEDLSLFVSSNQGLAAKCNPVTGKVDRHLFYSTNELLPVPVTASCVKSDRIAWGFHSGFITLLVRTKTSANLASRIKVFSEFHLAPVKIFSMPSNLSEVVLSGAEDGQIKLWDVTTVSCAWTFLGPMAHPTALKVFREGLIAGYSDGTIIIWNFDIQQILQLNRQRRQDSHFEDRWRQTEQEIDQNKRLISPGFTAPVRSLLYDEETRRVIVAHKDCEELRKYNVDTGECTAKYVGHVGAVTCVKWDVSYSNLNPLEQALKPRLNKKGSIIHLSSPRASGQNTPQLTSSRSTRLLVTGDDLGVVCLWNGSETNQKEVKPLMILSNGHISAISSIYVDACKIVTGSDDGWIRIWDPLTGANIHTLGNKIPRHAPVDRSDMDVMRVKNIWCNDYQGVATIGHQVKTWDFSPGKQLLNRRQLKPKGKATSGNARDRHRYEIDREMKDSLRKIESEKMERQQHEQKISKLTMEGLSDEEMLHYALMISQDSSPSSNTQSSESRHDYVDDDDDLLKAVIASLNVTDNDEDTNGAIDSDSDNSNNSKNEQNEGIETTEMATHSTPQEEEIDEELRLVLELSKTDK